MKTMSLWGEGVEGTFVLDVQHIEAYGCNGAATGDDVFVPSEGPSASLFMGAGMMGLASPYRVIGIVTLLAMVGMGVNWIGNRRRGSKSAISSEKGYETVGPAEGSYV